MHFFRVALNLWLCLHEIIARNLKNFKMGVMRQEVACCLHVMRQEVACCLSMVTICLVSFNGCYFGCLPQRKS